MRFNQLLATALLSCAIGLGQTEGGKFDGKWMTTVSCPPKGKTEGYKIQLPSVIANYQFRGEHGAAGQPGYLLLEGKIAADGTAKLNANGIVSSRKYGTGIFTSEGTDYSYKVNAQFQERQGSGMRDAGRGIVGRPCTFEFVKE